MGHDHLENGPAAFSRNAIVTAASPGRSRRRPSRKVRRNRTVAVLVVVVLAVILVIWVPSGGGGANRPKRTTEPGSSGTSAATRHGGPAARVILGVESSLVSWHLSAPLSRMVVEPSTGSDLTLLGGYDGAGSADGVFDLDTATGRLHLTGNLALPTHDAAGALLGNLDLVIGGGDTASDALVQALTPGRGAATAAEIGQLPSPRSDCEAVSIGQTVYVVGGYDGTNGDATVLATNDGRTYRSVATLPVPVRYPAVGVLGGKIYVFGGDAAGGPRSGDAIPDIQRVDPQTGSAAVIGSMPEPLEGASAVTIAGDIYVVGGDTSSAATSTSTSSTIWAFDPLTRTLLRAGVLAVAVSNAGTAVIGTTTWVIGGESEGVPVSTVQRFRTDPRSELARVPG
jgi:hypothetical protein